MASNINATYKRFNGTDWDTIYFATSAAQVGETSSRFFIKSSNTVNGKAFTQTGGIILSGADIKFDGTTGNYITTNTTLNAALEALDTAAKTAYDNITSGVLTSSNYSTTLGSVYQAKDADLTSIAGLTGTSGLLKKTAANTWALDTTTYAVPSDITTAINALDVSDISGFGAGKTLASLSETDGKISATFQNISITKSQISDFPTTLKNPNALTFGTNSYDGSAAKTIYADSVYLSSSDNTTIKSAIENAVSVANGKTKSYVTNKTTLGWSTYGAEVEITYTATTQTIAGTTIGALKVGDVFLITDTDVPDYWVGSIDTTNKKVKFYKMETAKVDLSNYQTKQTTLAGYGITDAKISGGVITLGSNTITPLTSHQSLDNYSTKANTVYNITYNSTSHKIQKYQANATTTAVDVVDLDDFASIASGVITIGGNTITPITSHQSLDSYVTKTGSETVSNKTITNSTYNGYTLAAACAKGVDTSVAYNSTSVNLPTSKAVANLVSTRATKIFYGTATPTSDAITGDVCIVAA